MFVIHGGPLGSDSVYAKQMTQLVAGQAGKMNHVIRGLGL